MIKDYDTDNDGRGMVNYWAILSLGRLGCLLALRSHFDQQAYIDIIIPQVLSRGEDCIPFELPSCIKPRGFSQCVKCSARLE